jgi:hypothetical protein
MDIQIKVLNNDEKKTYTVIYSSINKYTNRENNKKFRYYYGTKKEIPSTSVIESVVRSILNQYDDSMLFGTGKLDSMTIPPSEIKSQMSRKMKNMKRSHKGKMLLVDMDNNKYKQPVPKSNELNVKKFGASSIFKPEASAKTTCLLGASFTGKTTLLVKELNKLDTKDYDRIILFTESTNSTPLKDLDKKLEVQVYNAFVPSIIKFLKDINDKTKNKFRFLVVLDDVIELKNTTFAKLILTMRNSGISTIVLLQDVKLITPNTRNSMHNYYITGLRIEQWEYLLRAFLSGHMREQLNEQGSYQKLSERTKELINGKYILHYDQRKDEINYFLR